MEFQTIFRKAHADHARCLRDEWLTLPCPGDRPLVWSRRNGAWREVDILFVGAAPGNAGGRGAGQLGAHATRVPFGGDIAGANLDVLLGSIGITRNDTFMVAAYNRLPAAGGGEPTVAEIGEPVGLYESSLHLLHDTIQAARPKLIVALGNVGLRCTIATTQIGHDESIKLPTIDALKKIRFARNRVTEHEGLPPILWLTHPSAQNMSPFAREETRFHTRMLETRGALQKAAKDVLKYRIPRQRDARPNDGIYALKEWFELIGPHHDRLDRLWREKGV